MAAPLPTATSDRLKLALAEWETWNYGFSSMPSVIRQLAGKSNDSFLVGNESIRLVVRLNRDAGAHGVDRQIEHQVLVDIADRPFAPTVVHTDPDYLVTEYLNAAPPLIDLAQIAGLFRDIHETPARIRASLDPIAHAAGYLGQVAPNTLLAICLDSLRSRLGDAPFGSCLCHNDLLRENILEPDRGLVAIDWEYARLGDPAFDLAVFAETYRLDDAALRQLLGFYGEPELYERLKSYCDLYALIDILWWQIRDPGTVGLAERSRALANRLSL